MEVNVVVRVMLEEQPVGRAAASTGELSAGSEPPMASTGELNEAVELGDEAGAGENVIVRAAPVPLGEPAPNAPLPVLLVPLLRGKGPFVGMIGSEPVPVP